MPSNLSADIATFPGFYTPANRGDAIDYDLLERIAAASQTRLLRAAGEDLS
jgi:hypothetical protein